MENKELEVRNPELFITKSDKENVYALAGIAGPELMFQRLGEFLAVMLEQTGFYVTKVDDDKVDTQKVDMEEYGQDEEDNTKDLDKDSSDIA